MATFREARQLVSAWHEIVVRRGRDVQEESRSAGLMVLESHAAMTRLHHLPERRIYEIGDMRMAQRMERVEMQRGIAVGRKMRGRVCKAAVRRWQRGAGGVGRSD